MPNFPRPISSRSLIFLLLAATTPLAGCDRQSPAPGQAASNTADAAVPVAQMPDEMPPVAAPPAPPASAIDRSHAGEAARTEAFTDPGGKRVTLADFAGKPVLLNLWATWCAPCVAEMPTLDELAGTLGDDVRVLTVSQDLEGAAKVTPFFAKGGYRHLQPYLDADAGLSIGYQANLPTTILFDANGHELWRVAGGMDWAGPAAAALIAEAR